MTEEDKYVLLLACLPPWTSGLLSQFLNILYIICALCMHIPTLTCVYVSYCFSGWVLVNIIFIPMLLLLYYNICILFYNNNWLPSFLYKFTQNLKHCYYIWSLVELSTGIWHLKWKILFYGINYMLLKEIITRKWKEKMVQRAIYDNYYYFNLPIIFKGESIPCHW